MDNLLVRTIDSWRAKPSGIRPILGRILSPLIYVEPTYREAATVTSTSGPEFTEVPIDEREKSYLLYLGYYGLFRSFVVFSSEVRREMPKLHESIEDLLNNEGMYGPANLRLHCNGFNVNAKLMPENNGYSLRVKNSTT